MSKLRTTEVFSIALGSFLVLVAQVSFAQTKPDESESQPPKIRISDEPDESTSGSAPSAEKASANANSSADKAGAAGDVGEAPASNETDAVPDSVDSVVGSEPTTGLGPAKGVSAETTKQASSEDAAQGEPGEESLSEPRVIDISADDDAPLASEDLPPEEPKVPGDQLPFTYHVNHIDVMGGFRFIGTYDDGLEPFLFDPVMAEIYVRGGMAFGLTDRIALAPHIELGGTSGDAEVRGLSSQINKAHATLGLEGRYHFIHRMFGYARVAPGLEFVGATFGLEDSRGELSTGDFPGSVGFQFDAALGASLRLFGPDDGRKREPRLWIFAEGGYRASTKHQLTLSVDEENGPRRASSIELSPLHFSGGFFSTGLMASF